MQVCEGESFMLQCPEHTVIKLARNMDIQFGRGGDWEENSKCGTRTDNLTGWVVTGASSVTFLLGAEQ